MNQEKYIKQQSWRSKPREYRTVRPRVKDAAGWLNDNLPGGVKGKRILDLGTRDGWALDHYNQLEALSTTGLELVPRVAKYARKRGRNVMCGDMQNLPDALEGPFDCVIALHSLEHTPSPPKALEEMLRVCTSGGFVYVVVPKEDWRPGKDRAHNFFFSSMSQLVAMVCGAPGVDAGNIKTEEKTLVSPKGKKNVELRLLARKK